MKTLENIVLKKEEYIDAKDNPDGYLFVKKDEKDPKNDEVACTLSLIRLVLNNPLDSGENGEPKPHQYSPEEMGVAIRVIDKIKEAEKATVETGIQAVGSIELEDSELDLVKKLVASYKPFYIGLNWAPFIKQIVG